MKIMTYAIALTIALPAVAFAQQAPADSDHASMSCCERDADGNMAGCAQMNGDHAMNHDGAADQGMDHQNMDHGDMDHGSMNHDGDAGDHAGHPMAAE